LPRAFSHRFKKRLAVLRLNMDLDADDMHDSTLQNVSLESDRDFLIMIDQAAMFQGNYYSVRDRGRNGDREFRGRGRLRC
jgi:hypothetical protein